MIPVEDARVISKARSKDVVVIVAWEEKANQVDVVTYGRTPRHKISAAALGEILTKAAGCGPPTAPPFEDFRLRTVAELTADVERLIEACQGLLKNGVAYTVPAAQAIADVQARRLCRESEAP
jgi:hypothetical protein